VKTVIVTSENDTKLNGIENQQDKQLETIQESDGSSEHSDRETDEKSPYQNQNLHQIPMPVLLQTKSDGMRNQFDDPAQENLAVENEEDTHKRHQSWQESKKGRSRRLIRDDSELGARRIRLAQKSIGRYIEKQKKIKQEEQIQSRKQEEMLGEGEFDEIDMEIEPCKAYGYSLFDK